MDDLISRQAAIDALGKGAMVNYQAAGHDNGLIKAIGVIKGLPAAQPEYHMDEWCTDCKEYDHERHCCPRWNHAIRTTLQEVQAELDEKDWTFDDDTKQITFVVPIDVYNATQTIFISPGYEGETGLRGKVFLTQPERKKGKWKKWWEVKPDGFGGEVHIPHWACAECGTEYMPHLASAVHYCVNCGAQMEVENDE